jgi:hypothetical protein
MPVGVLFCKSEPRIQGRSPVLKNKMTPKGSPKKMSGATTPEIVPENKMVKLAEEDDSITVTYTLKLTKDKIADDEINPKWREACWAALLAMRNLDDEVVIRPSANLNEAFKDFGKTDSQTVNTCFMAEALTMAMLSKTYKEYMANQKGS